MLGRFLGCGDLFDVVGRTVLRFSGPGGGAQPLMFGCCEGNRWRSHAISMCPAQFVSERFALTMGPAVQSALATALAFIAWGSMFGRIRLRGRSLSRNREGDA